MSGADDLPARAGADAVLGGLSLKKVLARLLYLRRRELGALIAISVTYAVFTVLNPSFLTLTTFGGILTVAAEVGTITLGEGLLMISGEFDLSVGSNFTFSAIIFGLLLKSGILPIVALLMVLGMASLIGFLNGFITLRTRIPSFITTLGALFFWSGMALWITGGWPVSFVSPPAVLGILGGATIGATDSLHISAVWWAIVAVLFWLILEKSRYGNWVYGTGGKTDAARAVGVPVHYVKLINFTVCGLLAGLAGVLQLGRMTSISPVRSGLELEAIASAVVGGVSLFGGVGTVLGMILGTIALASIEVGLVSAGAPSFWYTAFVGAVIIVIVVMNTKLDELISMRRE
jgi:simple sugar transport system permease protein